MSYRKLNCIDRLVSSLRTTAAAAAIAVAASSSAFAEGTLRYAMTDEPPHLDVHVTTAGLTSIIAMQIFETLYTFNANLEPVPLLVASEETSEDGLTVKMTLRDNVPFHNGNTMDAGDAVASLKRWGEHGGRGKILFDKIESVEATGSHEVTIKFKEAFGPWKNLVAFMNGGPAIMPAEVLAEATGEPLANEQMIGTGPFKFKEWRPNRHIEVVRFDDYAQPAGKPDGFAGSKEVNLDAVRFVPVPDVGTRVSGVQAGDYDMAERIPGDLFEELDADDSVVVQLDGIPDLPLIFFNSAGGIMKDNYKLRQAIMASLKHDDALRIAVGPEDLWDDHGAIYRDGQFWYTDAGTENYPSGDVDKAKALAAEAGYNGETITFMISSSYPLHHDTGQVFAQQMKDAGFNIDLQVYDWPTLVERRAQAELWDMFETTHGAMPDPVLYTFMNDNYPGWWVSPEKEALEAEFTSTTDPAARKAIWDQLQALIYDQVPVVKPGDVFLYNIASPKVQGIPEVDRMFWPTFWNVSVN